MSKSLDYNQKPAYEDKRKNHGDYYKFYSYGNSYEKVHDNSPDKKLDEGP